MCESSLRFIRFKHKICVYTLCEWGAAILQVGDVLDWALDDSALCRYEVQELRCALIYTHK